MTSSQKIDTQKIDFVLQSKHQRPLGVDAGFLPDNRPKPHADLELPAAAKKAADLSISFLHKVFPHD